MRADAPIPDVGYRCIGLEVGAAGRRRARSRRARSRRRQRTAYPRVVQQKQAIASAERVAPYGFEMIEQPLHVDDLDALAALTRAVPLAVETCSGKRSCILLPVPVELI